MDRRGLKVWGNEEGKRLVYGGAEGKDVLLGMKGKECLKGAENESMCRCLSVGRNVGVTVLFVY